MFHKKISPERKTVKQRNEISHSMQLDKKSFWKFFERFKNLLAQCPHHGSKQ